MKHSHLLILGAPRSGTSLLSSLLAKHPEIAVLYEDYGFSLTKIIAKKYRANKLCIPNQIQLKKKRHKVFSLFINYLLRNKILLRYFNHFRFPLSYYSIEDYLQLSNIKIIQIIRDGSDVISSNINRGENLNFANSSGFWLEAIETMYNVWVNNKGKVMLISFDDLVCDTENTIQKASAFLGVDYDANMLDGYKCTPVYSGQKNIDKSKAHKHKESIYNIKELFPLQHKQYAEMLHEAMK